MSNKHSDQPKTGLIIGIVAAVVLGAAGTGIGIYQAMQQNKLVDALTGVTQAVNELKEDNAQGVNFASRAEFQQAIAGSIKAMEQQEIQAKLEHKKADFTAAKDDTGGKHIYGNMQARFTLVEFSDLECPFCKRFHDTPKQIVDSSNGNINWQWKHFPLRMHGQVAKTEAAAAECVAEDAGNKAFWMFVNDVFDNTRGNGGGVAELDSLIAGVGADVEAVHTCMASGKYKDKIAQSAQTAVKLGINGTPATFIVDNYTGNTQMLAGAQPMQAVTAALRKMVVEAKEATEEEQAAGVEEQAGDEG